MNKKLRFGIVLFSLILLILIAYAVASSSNASQSSKSSSSSSSISSSSSSKSGSLSSSKSSSTSNSKATVVSSDGAFTIDNSVGITENVGNSVSIDGLLLEVSKVTFKASPTKAGKNDVIVYISMTNKNVTPMSYSSSDFVLNENGKKSQLTLKIAGLSEAYLTSGSLGKGKSVKGVLVGRADKKSKVTLDYLGFNQGQSVKLTVVLN
ncbi:MULTISPECIES: DUF4352 domain-containing protein [unclassified Lactococcus]|uniref:DUF4352 domain-containing protein n=1 Tax=unclassified Lactococcus TaxID=2643510 RepID=UPI0011CB8841|nr:MULTISPECIES: DUF4352 domain-containing protein [unclassified Lactococcus]MQW22793.1 DUF4352 domain-containing protein [Lactococcus sp. dk101]TXK44797.1 DUF4352 domain-containing protein [Lactococcus sp. dk310]TXK50691.1 DUF4352 domain-containing protein [Lactococcus sp. dk322]